MTTSEARIAIGASPVTSWFTQFCVLPAVDSLTASPALSKNPSSSPMYIGHSGTPGPTLLTKISNGAGFVCAVTAGGAAAKISHAAIVIHASLPIVRPAFVTAARIAARVRYGRATDQVPPNETRLLPFV